MHTLSVYAITGVICIRYLCTPSPSPSFAYVICVYAIAGTPTHAIAAYAITSVICIRHRRVRHRRYAHVRHHRIRHHRRHLHTLSVYAIAGTPTYAIAGTPTLSLHLNARVHRRRVRKEHHLSLHQRPSTPSPHAICHHYRYKHKQVKRYE